jgi:hypothetical protein
MRASQTSNDATDVGKTRKKRLRVEFEDDSFQTQNKLDSRASALHEELDALLEQFLDDILESRIGLDSLHPHPTAEQRILEAAKENDRLYFDVENFQKTLLLQSNNSEIDVSEVPVDMLPNYISELEREVEEKSRSLYRQTARSVHLQTLVDRVVDAESLNSSEWDHLSSNRLRLTTEFEQRKTVELVELKNKLSEIRSTLSKLQSEIQELRLRNRELYQSRKTRRQGPLDPQIQEEINQLRGENRLLRNVFMKVVLGSGINWAEDETLRDAFLHCGDEPMI